MCCLSVEKGADTAIRAAASLSGRASVVTAGDGAARALANGLGAAITFLGWVPKSDLPALVRRAHIQVVPSRSEPQGMVVLEALASGAPVIASRIGGLPETVVDGENGFLFDSDDVDELRRAVIAALSDRQRIERMRANARDTAERYSPAKIARAAEAPYLE